MLAADHVIQDNIAFKRQCSDAIPHAESGKLVTFGIVPIFSLRAMAILKGVTKVIAPFQFKNSLKNHRVN